MKVSAHCAASAGHLSVVVGKSAASWLVVSILVGIGGLCPIAVGCGAPVEEWDRQISGGQLDEALAMLAAKVTEDPSSAAARVYLAKAQRLKGKPAEALVNLNYSSTLKVSGKLRTVQLFELATSNLLVGQQLLKDQNFKAAEGHLLQALQTGSGDAQAIDAALGHAYQGLQDYEKAETFLQKAIAASPQDVDSYQRLARVIIVNGATVEKQLKLMKEAFAANPNNRPLYESIIWSSEATGDEAIYVPAFEFAIEAFPGDEGFFKDYAETLVKRGSFKKAQEVYRRFIAAAPTNEDACIAALACLNRQMADVSQRTVLLDECLQNIGGSVALYDARLALIAESFGELKRRRPSEKVSAAQIAYVDAQEAVHSDRTVLHVVKAKILKKGRGVPAALAFVNEKLPAAPDSADLHVVKAALLDSQKKRREAIELLLGNIDKFAEDKTFRNELAYLLIKAKNDEGLKRLIEASRASMDEKQFGLFQEMVAVNRDVKKCLVIGSGKKVTATLTSVDESPPIADVSWTHTALKSGYVFNQCRNITIDATVVVSFKIATNMGISIFTTTSYSTRTKTFRFPALAPGASRDFSASTSLTASTMLDGWAGSSEAVTGVSVTPRLMGPKFEAFVL